jgi:hypothetical protein
MPAPYFAAASAFLEGRAGLDALETTTLSAADRDGLRFYQRLMHANVVHTMEALFPAVASLLGEGFDEVCRRWAAAHPSASWDVNGWADGFASWLAEVRPADAALAELADLHAAELEVCRPHAVFIEGRADNVTVVTRQYSHRVDVAVRELRARGRVGRPQAGPIVLFIYRGAATGLVHHHAPDLAELLAFGLVRRDACWADVEAMQLTLGDVTRAGERLAAAGLVSAARSALTWDV